MSKKDQTMDAKKKKREKEEELDEEEEEDEDLDDDEELEDDDEESDDDDDDEESDDDDEDEESDDDDDDEESDDDDDDEESDDDESDDDEDSEDDDDDEEDDDDDEEEVKPSKKDKGKEKKKASKEVKNRFKEIDAELKEKRNNYEKVVKDRQKGKTKNLPPTLTISKEKFYDWLAALATEKDEAIKDFISNFMKKAGFEKEDIADSLEGYSFTRKDMEAISKFYESSLYELLKYELGVRLFNDPSTSVTIFGQHKAEEIMDLAKLGIDLKTRIAPHMKVLLKCKTTANIKEQGNVVKGKFVPKVKEEKKKDSKGKGKNKKADKATSKKEKPAVKKDKKKGKKK